MKIGSRLGFTIVLAAATWMNVISCSETADQPAESVGEQAPALREGVQLINGVERSELAITMRLMYDQMKRVSDSLQQGQDVKTNFLERYKTIHTDVATEPEKIDEQYGQFADMFLNQYALFEQAEENKAEAFNGMLQACLACHQQKCPGPVKAIRKLHVKS